MHSAIFDVTWFLSNCLNLLQQWRKITHYVPSKVQQDMEEVIQFSGLIIFHWFHRISIINLCTFYQFLPSPASDIAMQWAIVMDSLYLSVQSKKNKSQKPTESLAQMGSVL